MKHLPVYIITLLVFSFSFAYENIDAQTFYKLMKEKDTFILDVRTPKEFAEEGHIKGANLIPVQLFKYIYLEGLRNKKVLVYCRSGNRSVLASKALESMGVKQVFNLKGGILEWKKAGFPIEKGFK
jgi:rhodanese-related sulfurtransferase